MAVPFGTRLRVITAVSSIALLTAGSALAQSLSPPSHPAGGGSPGAAGTAVSKPAAPAPNPLAMEDVSKIDGAAVYDSSGKKIGSVSTVLMQPSSKTIDRLVVGEGGILGIGSHRVALPLSAFSWDSQKGGFTVAQTADQLKSMPEWRQTQLSEAPSGGGAAHGQ